MTPTAQFRSSSAETSTARQRRAAAPPGRCAHRPSHAARARQLALAGGADRLRSPVWQALLRDGELEADFRELLYPDTKITSKRKAQVFGRFTDVYAAAFKERSEKVRPSHPFPPTPNEKQPNNARVPASRACTFCRPC